MAYVSFKMTDLPITQTVTPLNSCDVSGFVGDTGPRAESVFSYQAPQIERPFYGGRTWERPPHLALSNMWQSILQCPLFVHSLNQVLATGKALASIMPSSLPQSRWWCPLSLCPLLGDLGGTTLRIWESLSQ